MRAPRPHDLSVAGIGVNQSTDASVVDALLMHFAHATHRGLVREQNEDAIAIDEDSGLALVADGMGGYNAGEVASGLTAEFLIHHLVDDLDELHRRRPRPSGARLQRMLHTLLRARIDGVNEAIIDKASRAPELFGMGTTLALLLVQSDRVTTLHLGDSRIYRMRDHALSLLTRDHSLLQEQIDAGVLTPGEARDSVNRNFVTRALGVDAVAEPEIGEYDLAPGDLYLICSDGLPDMLDDEEIYDLLRGESVTSDSGGIAGSVRVVETNGHGGEAEGGPGDGRVAEAVELDEVAARLVAAANAHGGRDNVSVVLVSVGFAQATADSADAARPEQRDLRRA